MLEGKPWRTLTDWVYAGNARDAVRQFKKGIPAVWPKKFRKISAKKVK